MAAKQASSANPVAPKRRPKAPAERRKGWIVIALVGFGTLLFYVLGAMDEGLRYSIIGV